MKHTGSHFISELWVGKPQYQPLAEFKGKRKHMLMSVLGSTGSQVETGFLSLKWEASLRLYNANCSNPGNCSNRKKACSQKHGHIELWAVRSFCVYRQFHSHLASEEDWRNWAGNAVGMLGSRKSNQEEIQHPKKTLCRVQLIFPCLQINTLHALGSLQQYNHTHMSSQVLLPNKVQGSVV